MARNPRIIYKKNKPQEDFHADLVSPYLMFNGGLGSGKTYGLCMKLIHLSAINKDIPGGCLCPSFTEYAKDVLPTFETILDENGLLELTDINRGRHTITFPWTRAPLYMFTGEKRIKGPNLGYGGINEHSSIKFEQVQQFLSRVRVRRAPCRQIGFAGTPEDEYGWLHDFVEKQTKSGNLRIISGKTTDNEEHLAPEYIEHLRSVYDPQAFRLFAGGEMIRLGGNYFYYSFSQDRNRTDLEFNPDQFSYINLDFNVGNMHATIAQQYVAAGGKRISAFVDEIVLKHDGADTYAMINAIRARIPNGNFIITCDFSGKARKTTGPADTKLLKSAFGEDRVRYRATGNVRLRKRQLQVNGLLHHGNLLINPEKCPILWRDLSRVQQRVEDFSKCKKNPDLTHASDTLDYYCDFEYEVRDRQQFTKFKAR